LNFGESKSKGVIEVSYLFVTVAPGSMKDVHNELGEHKEIDFLLPVAGPYDILAKLNTGFGDKLYDFSNRVAQMSSVNRVNVVPSFKSKSTDIKVGDKEFCGCTMIRTNKSSEDIMDKIASLEGIAEVSAVAGDWNLMACLCGDDLDQLDMAALDIRKIDGITATESYIAFPQRLTEEVIGLGKVPV
jgi:DNA-binding Lrp family transcriptional regulator